ncbi:MAG: class I tRNA ligase family protein, partial [Thermoplasmata archaeon]
AIDDLLDKFPVDSLRYYLTVNMPEIRDADFGWDDFIAKNNGELVATYGNFVHRALSFTAKNYGEIPKPCELEEVDKKALAKIEDQWKKVGDHLEVCEFKAGIKALMELARSGNQYMDTKAPWSQIKEDKEACGTTLYVCLRIVRALSIMAYPFMPHSSERLWTMLGNEDTIEEHGWEDALENVSVGTKLTRPVPLFEKLELELEEEEEEETDMMDIRVAKVLSVEDHPNADKLQVMRIDIGTEKRTIVSGLKGHYENEELDAMNIIVLCNLQPAKLRGIESRGMLLAAEDGDVVSLLVDGSGAEPGARVMGTEDAPILKFEEFKKLRLRIGLGTEKGVQVAPNHFIDLETPEGKLVAMFFTGDDKVFPFKVGDAYVSLDKEVAPGSKIT